MQFSLAAAATTLLLLPLSALASPAPVAEPVAAPVALPEGQEPPTIASEAEKRDATSPDEIFARASTVKCKIVNVNSYANCRSGPGTGYAITHYPYKNHDWNFSCYKRGTCVSGNCTWDKLVWTGGSCYVSGYLTDSRCTMAALGPC